MVVDWEGMAAPPSAWLCSQSLFYSVLKSILTSLMHGGYTKVSYMHRKYISVGIRVTLNEARQSGVVCAVKTKIIIPTSVATESEAECSVAANVHFSFRNCR